MNFIPSFIQFGWNVVRSFWLRDARSPNCWDTDAPVFILGQGSLRMEGDKLIKLLWSLRGNYIQVGSSRYCNHLQPTFGKMTQKMSENQLRWTTSIFDVDVSCLTASQNCRENTRSKHFIYPKTFWYFRADTYLFSLRQWVYWRIRIRRIQHVSQYILAIWHV